LGPRRKNPFDSLFARAILHILASAVLIASIYYSISRSTWIPLAIGFAALTTLEGLWLYCHLRR
jgi:hypothetical protein